jgi:hypothetical protein
MVLRDLLFTFGNIPGFKVKHFLMHELAIMQAQSYSLLFETCPNKYSKHLTATHLHPPDKFQKFWWNTTFPPKSDAFSWPRGET